jgi:NADPH:quinone reductase
VIATDEEDLAMRVREITRGDGARVAFDPIAGPLFERLAAAMSPGGMMIEYGALSTDSTPFPLFPVLAGTLSVHGYLSRLIVSDRARLEEAKRFILDGLANGTLTPLIDKTFPFEQIVEAHRYLESNQQFGKVVAYV